MAGTGCEQVGWVYKFSPYNHVTYGASWGMNDPRYNLIRPVWWTGFREDAERIGLPAEILKNFSAAQKIHEEIKSRTTASAELGWHVSGPFERNRAINLLGLADSPANPESIPAWMIDDTIGWMKVKTDQSTNFLDEKSRAWFVDNIISTGHPMVRTVRYSKKEDEQAHVAAVMYCPGGFYEIEAPWTIRKYHTNGEEVRG